MVYSVKQASLYGFLRKCCPDVVPWTDIVLNMHGTSSGGDSKIDRFSVLC